MKTVTRLSRARNIFIAVSVYLVLNFCESVYLVLNSLWDWEPVEKLKQTCGVVSFNNPLVTRLVTYIKMSFL